MLRGGGGGGGVGAQPPYSQCYSLRNVSSSCITRKFVVRFVFCQKTGDSSGSNSCLKMNLCQPRSVIHRDNTCETILRSARDPTPARPACTRTQAQARQTGERSYANISQLDCCAYLISVYLFLDAQLR